MDRCHSRVDFNSRSSSECFCFAFFIAGWDNAVFVEGKAFDKFSLGSFGFELNAQTFG